MAPLENAKPPRLSVKSQSIDGGCGQSAHVGVIKRPSPEYLVRTGSLKNKVIPRDVRREHSSSNYAEYNIQTGCYTWQGRAYYKNSYMIQRSDGRSRRSFMDQSNRNLLAKNYPHTLSHDTQNRTKGVGSLSSKPSAGADTRYLDTVPTCLNNHSSLEGEKEKEKRRAEKGPSEVLNDDIKIQTATEKLAENKLLKKCLNTSKSHLDLTKFLQDNINQSESCKEGAGNTSQKKHSTSGDKESLHNTLTDGKQTRTRQSNDPGTGQLSWPDTCQSYLKNVDDHITYENWSPRMPSLENICQKYDDKADIFDPLNADHHRDQKLLIKMREKMKFLTDQQFNIDYKIVLNDMRGKDIENKLGKFASERELEKFRIYVEEFDSVNCLIRGLAGRLAIVEDNLDQLSSRGVKLDNRYVMAARKKDKLELQLSEALWIKNKIDRRTVKIERSLVKHCGHTELEHFNDFLLEKEQLISSSAELSDKIKLCKKQIMELELGHQILDM